MYTDVLDRNRRNNLKICFSDLREQIPELKDTERDTKKTITIRRQAKDCIDSLKRNENELIAELEKARGEKDRLTERMGALFVELSHYLN